MTTWVPPRAVGVRIVAELLAAVGLLTRLPVATGVERSGAAGFGVVGAGLGIVAAAPLVLLGSVSPLAGAILGLAALALASGALHLDGLADTADAVAAPSGDAAERARLDPRAGPAGVVALVLVLGLDAALLAALVERGPLVAAGAAIVAGSVSRASAALVPAVAGPTMRPGFGAWFAARTGPGDALVAIGTTAAVAVAVAAWLGRPELLGAGVVGAAGGAVATRVLVSLRDGLDGDAIGAVAELAFAATLLAAAVGVSIRG